MTIFSNQTGTCKRKEASGTSDMLWRKQCSPTIGKLGGQPYILYAFSPWTFHRMNLIPYLVGIHAARISQVRVMSAADAKSWNFPKVDSECINKYQSVLSVFKSESYRRFGSTSAKCKCRCTQVLGKQRRQRKLLLRRPPGSHEIHLIKPKKQIRLSHQPNQRFAIYTWLWLRRSVNGENAQFLWAILQLNLIKQAPKGKCEPIIEVQTMTDVRRTNDCRWTYCKMKEPRIL